MKVEGSGISARSILKDSECFAHLLRFYDGNLFLFYQSLFTKVVTISEI